MKRELQELIEKHGIEAVTEELMKILEKHFRRQELIKAAQNGLVRHIANQNEIKRRKN